MVSGFSRDTSGVKTSTGQLANVTYNSAYYQNLSSEEKAKVLLQQGDISQKEYNQLFGGYFYNPLTGQSVSSMKDLTQQGYIRLGYAQGRPLTQTEIKTLQSRESEVRSLSQQQTQQQIKEEPRQQGISVPLNYLQPQQQVPDLSLIGSAGRDLTKKSNVGWAPTEVSSYSDVGATSKILENAYYENQKKQIEYEKQIGMSRIYDIFGFNQGTVSTIPKLPSTSIPYVEDRFLKGVNFAGNVLTIGGISATLSGGVALPFLYAGGFTYLSGKYREPAERRTSFNIMAKEQIAREKSYNKAMEEITGLGSNYSKIFSETGNVPEEAYNNFFISTSSYEKEGDIYKTLSLTPRQSVFDTMAKGYYETPKLNVWEKAVGFEIKHPYISVGIETAAFLGIGYGLGKGYGALKSKATIPSNIKIESFVPQSYIETIEKPVYFKVGEKNILLKPQTTKGIVRGTALVSYDTWFGFKNKVAFVTGELNYEQLGKKIGSVSTLGNLKLYSQGLKLNTYYVDEGILKGFYTFNQKGLNMPVRGIATPFRGTSELTMFGKKTNDIIKNLYSGRLYKSPQENYGRITQSRILPYEGIKTQADFFKVRDFSNTLSSVFQFEKTGAKYPTLLLQEVPKNVMWAGEKFNIVSSDIFGRTIKTPVYKGYGYSFDVGYKYTPTNVIIPKSKWFFSKPLKKVSKGFEDFSYMKMPYTPTTTEIQSGKGVLLMEQPLKAVTKQKVSSVGSKISSMTLSKDVETFVNRNLAFREWYPEEMYQRTSSTFYAIPTTKAPSFSQLSQTNLISGNVLKTLGIYREPVKIKELGTSLKQKEANAFSTMLGVEEIQRLRYGQAQSSIQAQFQQQAEKLINPPISKHKKLFKDTFNIVPPPITSTWKFPFILPPFLSPSAEAVGARKVKARRITKYTPSYGALVFNIKGKPAKKTALGYTGIELRPIPKEFNYGRLFRKIKRRRIRKGEYF